LQAKLLLEAGMRRSVMRLSPAAGRWRPGLWRIAAGLDVEAIIAAQPAGSATCLWERLASGKSSRQSQQAAPTDRGGRCATVPRRCRQDEACKSEHRKLIVTEAFIVVQPARPVDRLAALHERATTR
jgi:hypothetical protein